MKFSVWSAQAPPEPVEGIPLQLLSRLPPGQFWDILSGCCLPGPGLGAGHTGEQGGFRPFLPEFIGKLVHSHSAWRHRLRQGHPGARATLAVLPGHPNKAWGWGLPGLQHTQVPFHTLAAVNEGGGLFGFGVFLVVFTKILYWFSESGRKEFWIIRC